MAWGIYKDETNADKHNNIYIVSHQSYINWNIIEYHYASNMTDTTKNIQDRNH